MAGNLNLTPINAHHVRGHEILFLYAVLPYEKVYLDGLPCAEMYEKSYMHRDIITHVLCTKLVHTVCAYTRGGHSVILCALYTTEIKIRSAYFGSRSLDLCLENSLGRLTFTKKSTLDGSN